MSQLNGFNEVEISALSENVVIEEFSDFGAVVEIGNDLVQDADESNGVDVRGAVVDFHMQPTQMSSSNGYSVVDDRMSCLEPGDPSPSPENVATDGDPVSSPVKEEVDLSQDQAETNSSGNVNCSFEIERNPSNVKEESPNAMFRVMFSPSDSASHETDVSCTAETDTLIKKEEDIDAEEAEVIVSHNFDVPPEQGNNIYDEVSVANCDKVEDFETKLNSQDDLSFSELTNDGSRPLDGVQLSEVYYDRARIRLVEVSVVLEDLFPKSRAGNAQFTAEDSRVNLHRCQNSVGDSKGRQKLKESKEFCGPSKGLQRRSEESTVKEWYSCTECPARFRFGHSLELHATRSHHIYFCTECDVSYKLQSDLRLHFSTHRSRKLYSCLCCGFKSKTELELRIHAKSHRSDKLFSCGECFAEFEENRLLATHISGHTNEKRFECAHCSVKFRTKSGIRAHVLDHLGRKPFCCTLCSAKFKRRKRLKEHLTRHSKEKPHLCTHCPATFRFIRELKTHLSTHAKKTLFYSKIFSCSTCAAKFKFSSDLKEHMATHHADKKKLSCAKCGAVFKTKTAMKRHEASHLETSQSKESLAVKNKSPKTKRKHSVGAEEKLHSCPHCSASFKKKFCLTKHLSVHSEDRPWSCPDCDSTFKTKEYLKLHHLVTHTNERQFACTYCQSRFKTKKALRQHTLIHFNIKPFACSHCSATFKHKKVLTLHMLTHTNARPHLCSVCSASFKFKGSLQRHMASHSDEKVFACPLCPAKLKQERYLKDHIRMHENNTLRRTVSCPHCRASFKSKKFLKRHMAKHTDEKLGFACPHCPLNFKQNRFLLTHLKTHANKTTGEKLSCVHCSSVFQNRQTLEQHLRTHQNQLQETDRLAVSETWPKFEEDSAAHPDNFTGKCSNEEAMLVECPARFETQSAVDSNKSMETSRNTETEPFFVDCTSRLKTETIGEEDVAATEGNEEIEETFSFADFTTRIKVEPVDVSVAHRDEFMETNDEEAFSFVDCSARVKTESTLEQLITDGSVKLTEIFSNEESEAFSCEQCSAAFQTRQNLEKHVATHSNKPLETFSKLVQRPRSANTRPISKKQPAASALVKHAKNHSEKEAGESFVCAHCQAKFETRVVLVQHLAAHHRGYSCKWCNAKFRDPSSLVKHTAEHYKIPYECKECPAKLSNINSFWQHQKKHTKEKNMSNVQMLNVKATLAVQGQIRCIVCSVHFQNHEGLVFHWEKQHRDKVPPNCLDFGPVEWGNQIEQLNEAYQCLEHPESSVQELPHKEHVDEKNMSSTQCANESSVTEASSETVEGTRSVQGKICCAICSVHFQNHADLVLHWESHCRDKVPGNCPKSIKPVEQLTEAYQGSECPTTNIHEKHADKKNVSSVRCADESSVTEASSENHGAACSVQEQIRCNLCSLHFQNHVGLAFHWEKHHSDVPRSRRDGDPSKWRKQLKEPSKEGSALKRFDPVPLECFCGFCSVKFKDRVSLEDHLKNYHSTTSTRSLKVEFVRTLKKIV